jgi:hypothetical protein
MPVNRLVVLSPTGPGWLRVQQPCDVPRGQLARSGYTGHERLSWHGLDRLRPRRGTITRTARVLVVDDLEGMRALLGEVLGLYGYEALTAAGVPEAEAIRQRIGGG